MEELFRAWGIEYNPNDERNELASKRIEVCNSCPNKKEIDGVRNVCSQTINGSSGTFTITNATITAGTTISVYAEDGVCA